MREVEERQELRADLVARLGGGELGREPVPARHGDPVDLLVRPPLLVDALDRDQARLGELGQAG